jgi:hypothetical protein
MGDLYFFLEAEIRESVKAMRETTEVSRSHSSEETFVMKVERRAESLKRGSFFLEVVKANNGEKQTG